MHTTTRVLPDGSYLIPLNLLKELLISPFEQVPWDCEQFSAEDVLSVSPSEYCDTPYVLEVQDWVAGQTGYHISRIAYLKAHGWEGEEQDHRPLLSVESDGRCRLLDGNHRFAAAVLRDDQFFLVEIDGFLDAADEVLNVQIEQE